MRKRNQNPKTINKRTVVVKEPEKGGQSVAKKTPKQPAEVKKPAVSAVFSGFRTFVRIGVVGVNQARLINRLREAQIGLLSLEKYSVKEMRLTVRKKDSAKTFAILQELCYTYEVIGRGGLFPFFKANLFRVGIAAGVIAALMCVYLLSGSVLKIELNPLETISRQDLLNALKTEGIAVGTRTAGLSRDEIRQAVNRYPGVAECSVELRGSTLKLTVIEKTGFLPPAETGAAVVAEYDAEITRMITVSGTAKKTVGARVKKGDILIEGALYDTNGELMHETPAAGTVYGRIASTYSTTVSTLGLELGKTGNSCRRTVLTLFGLKIGRDEPPYGAYERKTVTGRLNAFLPIYITQSEYVETALTSVEYELDALIEAFKTETLAAYIERDAKNLEASTAVRQTGENVYEVFVYVTGELMISSIQ